MKPYRYAKKKQSRFFGKSLTWGHRKSTRNIMFENKKHEICNFLTFFTKDFHCFSPKKKSDCEKNKGPANFYRWWDLFFYFHNVVSSAPEGLWEGVRWDHFGNFLTTFGYFFEHFQNFFVITFGNKKIQRFLGVCFYFLADGNKKI